MRQTPHTPSRANNTVTQDERNEWIIQQWGAGHSPAAIIRAGTQHGYRLTNSSVSGVIKRGRERGDRRCAIRNPERTALTATEQRRKERVSIPPQQQPRPPRLTTATPADTPAGTLGKGGCRWICGEIAGLDTPTCGAPQRPGYSWCEAHCVRAFDPRFYKPERAEKAA